MSSAGNVEPSSRIGVTLDLILKTLIASSDFTTLETKNWEAIARLIPGTTAIQVTFYSFYITNKCLSYATYYYIFSFFFGKTFFLLGKKNHFHTWSWCILIP